MYVHHMVDTLCDVVAGKATMPAKDNLGKEWWATPLVEVLECAACAALGPAGDGENIVFLLLLSSPTLNTFLPQLSVCLNP
jgi:hypothetical protein